MDGIANGDWKGAEVTPNESRSKRLDDLRNSFIDRLGGKHTRREMERIIKISTGK